MFKEKTLICILQPAQGGVKKITQVEGHKPKLAILALDGETPEKIKIIVYTNMLVLPQ